MVKQQQLYFEEIQPDDLLPSREYGPLTVTDTVRWAGLQENWQHLHFDRDHVREHSGLRTFIASGAYRQALLIRMLTDWISPLGRLRKLNLRQTHPTFEGDMLHYFGQVVEKSSTPDDPWIMCDLEGKNQDGRHILKGRCTIHLPSRTS